MVNYQSIILNGSNMVSGLVNRSSFLVSVQVPLNLNPLILFMICACRMKKLQFRNERKKVMLVNLGEFIVNSRIP